MKHENAKIGVKVGKLTILELLEKRNKADRLIAKCSCECNLNIKTYIVSNLGIKTFSCGCFRNACNPTKQPKNLALKETARVLQHQRKNNNEFSFDEIKEMIFSNCFYCEQSYKDVGINIEHLGEKGKRIGIDRINSDFGYLKNNSVQCCWFCNRIKIGSSIKKIIEDYKIIGLNALKLYSDYKPLIQSPIKYYMEHVENCFCNKKYRVSLNERLLKNTYIKYNYRNDVNISKEIFNNLIFAEKCFYCERHITEVGTISKRNGYQDNLCYMRRLSIDRIDSSLNYNIDNVVSCCFECNTIKGDSSLKLFGNNIIKIHEKITKLLQNNKILLNEESFNLKDIRSYNEFIKAK